MKYEHVRIEAVQRCEACGGTGERPTTTRIDTVKVVREPCWACDGRGEVRTALLHPGEPFFLVRGQDMLAENIVAIYGLLYGQAHGLQPGEWPEDLEAMLEFIRTWQEANPGLVKRPD